APAADDTPAEAAPRGRAAREAEAAEQADADAPRGRARRRATRKAAAGFTAPAAAGTRSDDDNDRRPARPAVAVFQAPVFAEPMFQTPERAAAAAAAEAAEQPVEAAPAPAAEEETGPRRRRRRRAADEQPAAPVAAEPEEPKEPEGTVEAEPAEAEADVDNEGADEAADGEDAGERHGRRRRRGGRRRRRGESADADGAEQSDDAERSDESGESDNADDTDESDEAAAERSDDDSDDAEASGGSGSSSSRRRRRRRRRAGDSGEAEPGDGDPERTVVKVREPRKKGDDSPSDEVQSIKGSTRLEAKKQRRREGREQGRRRVPIITEAEFLARREAVNREMIVRQNGDRTQIGVLEDNILVEHYVNKEQSTSYVGNVYLGKVQNVLPSMEAAFIDIGKGRNAVLYAGEVNFEALGMANGPRRIESALKSGQSVLVQVTKDPIGHKGARLTSQVSLPGRYLVYVPEGSMTGISRKLPDTERARLKTILKKIVPEDAGVIVRTAAEGASEDELRRDVERLQAQWEDILKKSKMTTTSSPSLLYGEPDMTVRVVRDIFNEDFSKVVISGDEAWETIHGYVSHVAPDLADRLSRWTSEVDVFATYRIDEQLAKALDRKVWLPSGGSLVIDKTEAMVVIDVNTGKFTGQGGNLEETVTRNNLEAAEEIVRQLRLRDLGGIVVIDFIDMVLESNRDLVLRRMLECLGRDRTKHQVAEVTSLGLVQMTRKRVGQGLLESFSETCVHCNGRGLIVHMDQATTAGGGGKRKKRGRGGADQGASHDHTHEGVESGTEAVETAAEVAAEVAEPVALPEPAFVPDEELYSSPAEAEAAASRGRSRRRATRRASAPAGAPKSETAEVEAPESAEKAEQAEQPEQAEKPAKSGRAAKADKAGRAEKKAKSRAGRAKAEPVESGAEAAEVPEVAEVVETPAAPAVEAPVEDDAAPKGRTRRRATRKATAPAGSPKAAADSGEVIIAEAAKPEPVVEAPVAEPVAQAEPVVEAAPEAPARPRRRAVRKATAPTASEETAVMVVPAADKPSDAAAEQAPEAPAADAEEAAPAAKKAARKTAKKATAKKAATKKTAAKKTAAKKTAAKKTTAKKAAKTTKKAAAAEQSGAAVTAPADAG
ncbi:Rne/Rng family ribonuclease, partial [Streptomyces alboflavus]|uniref:Rne/Rng family ribonuclease n=1 Tax=Streptomyces alboflavus TaxID=67267 RepID=UPI0036D18956